MKKMMGSPVAGVRVGLAVGASLLALSVTQPAVARLCADGSEGPVCFIDNSGSAGAIAGTVGTSTVVTNSGTITGAPAIGQGGSFLLSVSNAASGVIDGNGGTAIIGAPSLGFLIANAGTINGNIVFDDQPSPNIFAGPLVSYISDGGILNGNLQLGTTGFSSAYFLQRGADDGIMGSLFAGAGLDIYAKSYDQTRSVALGQFAKPADFEIEGYEIRGSDKTLTLTGSGTTINLAGNGNVVNQAQIDLVDIAGVYPSGVDVVPMAISYYQPQIATFRRQQIPLGQQGSFYTQTFGSALASFTNNGIVNGDIRLATMSFVNMAAINLKTHSTGSVIYSAPDSDFLFRNSGTIVMADNGARIRGIEAEFDNGVDAAVRIRSALNTTGTRDARIENSGDIVGGLDARLAAGAFSFENSGTIAGIETANHFSRGLSINVGELDLVVGQDARDEYNAQSATILNSATGVIDHGFLAVLNANIATVENRGRIAASGREGGIALYVEHGLLSDDDNAVPGAAEAAAASLSLVNSGTIQGNVALDSETAYISISNSGDITRGPTTIRPDNFGEVIFGGSGAFELFNETDGDHVVEFVNSGSIISSERGGGGLGIEVEAGDDYPGPGMAPLIGSASVKVINSGTIAATGGATVTPAAVATFLPAGSILFNPIAALHVDATDVTGASSVTIENRLGGVISASGNIGVVTSSGYLDQGAASNAASTVAVAASGKVVNIINAGRIEGGAGSDYSVNPNIIFDEVYLPDRYLAGAIHTLGDEPDLDNGEIYTGSIDHVVNRSTGVIVGSIDLGANDDVIENYGSITGNVFLREGNDSFIQSLLGSYDGLADGGQGVDTLIFDISGALYSGAIDPVLRAKFINFEIEKIVGSGIVVANDQQVIADAVALTLEAGSNVDVGAGNVALLGSETTANAVTVAQGASITGVVDLQGGDNTIDNQGSITGNLVAGNGHNTIANSGVITGNVMLGDGANSLANSGSINGSVNFGDGGNSFTNSGAVEQDILFGSGADELLLVGNWSVGGQVDGGAGIDSVQLALPSSGVLDLSGFRQIEQFNLTGDATGIDRLSLVLPGATVSGGQVPVLDLSAFQQIDELDVNGGLGKIGGSAIFEAITVNDGRLIGDYGSVITASIAVGSGATFGSAGTVNGDVAVASGGTLSPGASVATMTVNGDMFMASGTTTIFEFEGTQADQIIINNGSLNIAEGAIVQLAGTLTPGTTRDLVIVNDGAINGTFLEDANHPGVVGVLRYFDSNGDLVTDRLQLLGTFVTAPGASGQTQASVDYVNDLLISGEASSALLAAVPTLINGDGTANAAAFGQVTGEAYASASQMGVENGLSIARAARGADIHGGGEDAALFTFAHGLGDRRTFKGGSGVSHAKARSYGALGGIGYGDRQASLSLFVGYLDARETVSGLKARTDADGMVAGIAVQARSGEVQVMASAAYNWANAKTQRAVPNGTSFSRYDLDSLSLDVSASYDMAMGERWTLRPSVGVTHVSTRRGATTESGSAAFALDVDGKVTHATFVDGALALRGVFGAVQPWAQLGMRHQLGGATPLATAGFTGMGGSLTVRGAARKDTVLTANAGLAIDLTPAIRMQAAYTGEFGGGEGHGGHIGLRIGF